MGRRAEHLHKRGTKWYLRVRVPDDLRPIVGKGEVWRSLRTSDASLARNLVRAESLKVSAEFDEARRKLRAALPSTAKATPVDLTDAEVWQLVARFFASAERRASAPLSPEAVRAGIEELSELEDYEGAAPNVYRHVGAILKEAGIANPTDGPALSHGPGITRADGSAVRSSTAEKAPPWLMKLHFGVHAALVESGRRHLERPKASFTDHICGVD
jgi:hypothetical protein